MIGDFSFQILDFHICRLPILRLAKPSSDAEFLFDIEPKEELLRDLRTMGADVFTFWQRNWVHKDLPSYNFRMRDDNVALLRILTYDHWLRKQIDKKTRNMVVKAGKKGVKVELCELSHDFARGISEIYNESPTRQGMPFRHYGKNALEVYRMFSLFKERSEFIGAFFKDSLIGFIQLMYGEGFAMISSIVSMKKYFKLAPNNALIAKAVEVCSNRKIRNLTYYKLSDGTTLDKFKENNGFQKWLVPRYYIHLNSRGQIFALIKCGRAFPILIDKMSAIGKFAR